MRTKLGKFEGKEVQTAVARFSGRTTQRVGAFDDGEEAIVIAKVKCTSIGHRDFKVSTGRNSPNLYARIQDFKTTRAVVLPFEEVSNLLEEAIIKADDSFGVQSLLTSIVSDDAGADDGDGED